MTKFIHEWFYPKKAALKSIKINFRFLERAIPYYFPAHLMNQIDPVLPGEVDEDSHLNADNTVRDRLTLIIVPENIFGIQPELMRISCSVYVFFVKILYGVTLAAPIPAYFKRIQDQYKPACGVNRETVIVGWQIKRDIFILPQPKRFMIGGQ